MRSVELFSGCGGLALGLARAGFHHDAMVEWNECAVATIEHNRARGVDYVASWPIRRTDVREIDWKRYAGMDLVAGGPPCQPFSIAGKHRGSNDDRDMWPQAIRAVREIKPAAFLFENVRGLLRPKFSDYLRSVVAGLQEPDPRRTLRYSTVVMNVNAADFGAPQKRHRVIIAGIRDDLGAYIPRLQSTYSRERLLWDQWVTGEYWQEHGLRRDLNGFEPADEFAVRRLRSSMREPQEKRWTQCATL